nr:CbtA family protein [Nocardioides perillae]
MVHGLLAGLMAGLLACGVAYAVGEPSVDAAIALEGPAGDGPVPRTVQRTVGLLVGTLAIGLALGGLAALASAAAVGRLGRLSPAASTALVTAVGGVAVSLVPFLKYPATPPAVGDGATIGGRTAGYFALVLASVVAAGLALWLGRRLLERSGAWAAVVAPATAYVVVVAVVAQLLPDAAGVGGFPADLLWDFRVGSLATLATLWVALAAALSGLVGRSWAGEVAAAERRALAASL